MTRRFRPQAGHGSRRAASRPPRRRTALRLRSARRSTAPPTRSRNKSRNGSGGRVREHQFRSSLAGRLGERSVDSYVAYCSRVERELNSDVDQLDLSEQGIETIALKLAGLGVTKNSVRNCCSALRAYSRISH